MLYRFRLYVTGATLPSQRAIENLQRICDLALPGQHEIEVIDVLERPQLAEEDKILATPTLLRRGAASACKIIGDLSDDLRVLQALDLTTNANQKPTLSTRKTDEIESSFPSE